MIIEARLCIKGCGEFGLISVQGAYKGEEGAVWTKMGTTQPIEPCHVYFQTCSSDVAGTIAKQWGYLIVWLGQGGRES
eukprot:scaffold13285_cov19-Tisochrysis_lutea.AAC.5